MSFRVDRIIINQLIMLLVSGKLTGEHLETLRNLLREESGSLAIDLKNVSLVDRDAVQLLAFVEHGGTELRNCPKYVREWINREREGMHGGN